MKTWTNMTIYQFTFKNVQVNMNIECPCVTLANAGVQKNNWIPNRVGNDKWIGDDRIRNHTAL